MTLEAWVKPASLADWSCVILKERSGGLTYSMYAADGGSRPPSTYLSNGSDVAAVGTSVLPLNTWSYLTGTYDGSTLRTYVNGVLVGSRAIATAATTSTAAAHGRQFDLGRVVQRHDRRSARLQHGAERGRTSRTT